MKMKTIQRAFAWALTLVMVLSAAPLGVFAEGEEGQTCICTVKCGETGNESCPVCAGAPAACAAGEQGQLGGENEEKQLDDQKTGAGGGGSDQTGNGDNQPDGGNDEPDGSDGTSVNTGSGETETVTVTFEANEGIVTPKTMTTKKGSALSDNLPTPTREGYAFGGWFETQDCTGTKVEQAKEYTDDTTLYAKWTKEDPTPTPEPEKFVTVTFDFQIEDAEKVVKTTDANGKLTEGFPVVENPGYLLEGWYKNQNCTEENKVTGEPTFEVDTTLYAKWTAITPPEPEPENGVTVTFKFQLDGVTDETRKTNAEGMLEEKLPQPSKDGFDFLGWYLKSEDSEERVAANETVFKEDTTVYAKWKQQPEAAAVTFDAKGGICAVTSAKVNTNKKLDSLPNPTREGYTFLGWYIQGTETKVTVETPYETSTTLEARWEKVVSVEKTEGIIPGEDFLKGIPLNEGTEKVKIVVNEGNKEEAEKSLANVLGDRKLLAVYDLSVQMLDQNGGSLGTIQTVNGLIQFDFTVDREVVAVYHNTTPMEPSTGTTEGYRYSDGTLTIWAKSFSPYAIVVNPVAVTVTFDPVGGTVDPKTLTTGTDGKLKDALPTPTRTGYTFDGWYFDKNYTGNKIAQGEIFLWDCTVYAKWNPNTYTVTFHDNYNDPEVKSQQTFTYDVAQSLDCGSTIRRDYYTLSGWAETSGGPKKFAPTETVQSLIPEGNKDLYALWTYEPRRVTFDADGGKIKKDGAEVDKVTVNTQEAPINTVKAADVPVPELREGYYFGGWYTQKNGKGDLVKTGETKEPTVFTRDATVYAYWVEFEPVTVTFKCQGGTARIGSTDVKEFTMQTKWPGVLDGTPSTPGRSGYKFEGWYTAAGVKVDADTLFLRNSTVYARWKRAVSITGNPRTGDQVKLEAAIGILAAAAIGLGATVVLKKRKEK